MKHLKYIFIGGIIAATSYSCKKGPGIGGKATITGKVYEYNYNNDFSVLKDEYYKGDHDVYIVYGDDNIYSDNFKTHYDGTFEFNYLLPGEYTIYVYSSDTNITSANNMTVTQKVTINEKKEVVDIGTIEVYDL
ncbi:MAG: hypothetical protein N4A35_00750 [Flavobacteriales bacterium]|jgi:hypothetical protein|nr:hypothetical protein [Flavobacteriales bacterium]